MASANRMAPGDGFRLAVGGAGHVVVFWLIVSGSGRVIAALIQNVRILRMDHHRHALLASLLQAGQQLAVIHVEGGALIGQEQFHGGDTHLHQLFDLTDGLIREIVAAGVNGDVGSHLAFGADIQAVVDGIHQVHAGFIGAEVHNGSRSSLQGHPGSGIGLVCGDAVRIERLKVGVVVHTAGEHIFALCIQDSIKGAF